MKKIIVILFSLLLVGCSANYTLTIDEDSYEEKVQITPSSSEEREILFSNDWKIPIDYNIYSATDDSENSNDLDVNHYEYNKQTNNIEFTYNFKYNEITKSTAFKKCFNSARIVKNNNNTIITTDEGSTCFDDEESLDSLTINIIINKKKVINNNADRIIGNKYIWYINKDNYLEKSINITYEEEQKSPSSSSSNNKTNNNFFSNIYFDNSMLIFGLIFFIIVGIVVLIYKKISKDDE